MSRDRCCGHHTAETPLHASHMLWYVKVKNIFIVILIPKRSLHFRTGWSVGEHAFAWSSKHTLPRQARSTLNELQQNQHEKAPLVCVRVQSPSGLALVPCAFSMVDLSGQLRCWITHPCHRKMFCFLFLAPYARKTRYEEAFFPWKPRKKRLASLGRLILIIDML